MQGTFHFFNLPHGGKDDTTKYIAQSEQAFVEAFNGVEVDVDDEDAFNPFFDGEIILDLSGHIKSSVHSVYASNYAAFVFSFLDTTKTLFYHVKRVQATYNEDVRVVTVTLERDLWAGIMYNLADSGKNVEGRPTYTSIDRVMVNSGGRRGYPVAPITSGEINTGLKEGAGILPAKHSLALTASFKGEGTTTSRNTIVLDFDTVEEAFRAAEIWAGASQCTIRLYDANDEEDIKIVDIDVENMVIIPNTWCGRSNSLPPSLAYVVLGGEVEEFPNADVTLYPNIPIFDNIPAVALVKGAFFEGAEWTGGGGTVNALDYPLTIGTPSKQIPLTPSSNCRWDAGVTTIEDFDGVRVFVTFTIDGNVFHVDLTESYTLPAGFNATSRELAQTKTSRGMSLLASGIATAAGLATGNYFALTAGALGIAGEIVKTEESKATAAVQVLGEGSAHLTYAVQGWNSFGIYYANCSNFAEVKGARTLFGWKVEGGNVVQILPAITGDGYVQAERVYVVGGTQEEKDEVKRVFERGVNISLV